MKIYSFEIRDWRPGAGPCNNSYRKVIADNETEAMEIMKEFFKSMEGRSFYLNGSKEITKGVYEMYEIWSPEK